MRQVRAQLFAYLVLGLHNVVLHAQAEVHAQVARRLARGERALLDRHEIFAKVGRVGRTFRGNKAYPVFVRQLKSVARRRGAST